MKKKGLTLVELIVSIAIFSIIITIVFNFLISNDKIFTSTSKSIEKKSDVRTAMEYISNQIMNANKIELHPEPDLNEPLVINNISNDDELTNYLSIDGNKIYIINNTISYNSDSDGIVSDISSIEIEDKKNDLYMVKINGKDINGKFSQSSYIKKRK